MAAFVHQRILQRKRSYRAAEQQAAVEDADVAAVCRYRLPNAFQRSVVGNAFQAASQRFIFQRFAGEQAGNQRVEQPVVNQEKLAAGEQFIVITGSTPGRSDNERTGKPD